MIRPPPIATRPADLVPHPTLFRSVLDEAAPANIIASVVRSLVSDYWGGYVAVLKRPDGAIATFRDPSGLLPCYYREEGADIKLSSDAAELGRRGGVDYEAIARDRKSTRLNSSHSCASRMPSSA